ncbi:MAG: DUF1521 domain-containing protein [Pseudomonadota bacterium]
MTSISPALATLDASALADPQEYLQSVETLGQFTATVFGVGMATLAIGSTHVLGFDKLSSSLSIANVQLESLTALDQALNVDTNSDAITDFRLEGATTFQLETGVKITLHTRPLGDPGLEDWTAAQVIVTDGQDAAIITGLSQDDTADLAIELIAGAYYLDRETRDGWRINEQSSGAVWLSGQNTVDQGRADITHFGQLFGSGGNTPTQQEVVYRNLSGVSVLLSLSLFASSLSCSTCSSEGDYDVPRDDQNFLKQAIIEGEILRYALLYDD